MCGGLVAVKAWLFHTHTLTHTHILIICSQLRRCNIKQAESGQKSAVYQLNFHLSLWQKSKTQHGTVSVPWQMETAVSHGEWWNLSSYCADFLSVSCWFPLDSAFRLEIDTHLCSYIEKRLFSILFRVLNGEKDARQPWHRPFWSD